MIWKRICSQIPKMLLKINFWWFGLIRNRNRDIFRNLKIASERQFFNHILFILDSCPCKSLSFSIKPLAISLHFLSFSIDFRLIFWFPFIFVSRTSPFNFQGLEKVRKMVKKKSGFSGFEGLVSYMWVSYMWGGGVNKHLERRATHALQNGSHSTDNAHISIGRCMCCRRFSKWWRPVKHHGLNAPAGVLAFGEST